MAVVSTVLGTTLSRTVFTKPPDYARQYSAIPRAIVNFSLSNGVLDLKPINDQQELQIGIVLDPTFAYRLVDFNVSVAQTFAWDNVSYLEIQNGLRNLPVGSTQRYLAEKGNIRQNTTRIQSWIARMGAGLGQPSYVLQAIPGQLVVINYFANNDAAPATSAGEVDALFTFFEYELEQAEFVALHYATLTYDR